MNLFKAQENRIRCGQCNTEFDLNKNMESCPWCGFSRGSISKERSVNLPDQPKLDKYLSYSTLPKDLKTRPGKVVVDEESKIWGSSLMFNDIFAPKFLMRITANLLKKQNAEYISVNDLISVSRDVIKGNGFSKLKGFPNDVEDDNSLGRLVYHFLKTAVNMGLFEARSKSNGEKVWSEKWENILITITNEGLEFARLPNSVFDEGKKEQVLTSEERKWLINYFRRIDNTNYREYSTLREVYEFLSRGKCSYEDLCKWFRSQKRFVEYVKGKSKMTTNTFLGKQLENYSQSFASSKISLLRELGVIKNKRNDYTVLGAL